MKPLPLPLRLAAGLAVSARERAKDLPRQITGLPVTVASQVLQASMRLQQQVTELAIKGDEALSGVRPIEETPSWATFDEDLVLPDDNGYPSFDDAAADIELPAPRAQSNGHGPATVRTSKFDQASPDPWEEEENALAAQDEAAELAPDTGTGEPPASAPAWLADYDSLSLPQLRAKLRQFSTGQLAELLAYERATANRPSFAGMLERRIGKLSGQDERGDNA